MAFSFGTPASAAPPTGPSNTAFSFGQPQQSQQQQQQQAPSRPSSTGAFSFGQPSASTSTNPPPANSNPNPGFSFSQPASTSNTAQAQAPAPATTGGFSFGAPKPAAPSNPSGFSFGAPANSNTTTQSSFGQSQPQTQFGQSQNQPQQNQNQNQQQQQQDQPPQHSPNKRLGLPLSSKIDLIKDAFDVQNLQTCRFLTYFYNSVPPQQIKALSDSLNASSSGGGANANGNSSGNASEINYNTGRIFEAVGQRHENLWSQAVRECPDRENLLPVLARGYSDLSRRLQSQQTESTRQLQHLQSLSQRLSSLVSRHDLSNVARIKAASNKQRETHRRVLGLVGKSSGMILRLRNGGIEAKEEELRNKLEGLEVELNGGVGGGNKGVNGGVGGFRNSIVNYREGGGGDGSKLNPRIHDLWAMLSAFKNSRNGNRNGGRENENRELEWALVDEEKMNEVARILGSQQQGLSHLLKTLDSDNKSLDVVLRGLEGVGMVKR